MIADPIGESLWAILANSTANRTTLTTKDMPVIIPGWTAAFFEWLATYLLIWPADGIVRKEDVGVIDLQSRTYKYSKTDA